MYLDQKCFFFCQKCLIFCLWPSVYLTMSCCFFANLFFILSFLLQVFETFGPVQTPFYSVRFNVDRDISEKNVHVGNKVFYAPDMMEFSNFVFVTQLKKYVQLSIVKEMWMGWANVRSDQIVKSRDTDLKKSKSGKLPISPRLTLTNVVQSRTPLKLTAKCIKYSESPPPPPKKKKKNPKSFLCVFICIVWEIWRPIWETGRFSLYIGDSWIIQEGWHTL